MRSTDLNSPDSSGNRRSDGVSDLSDEQNESGDGSDIGMADSRLGSDLKGGSSETSSDSLEDLAEDEL